MININTSLAFRDGKRCPPFNRSCSSLRYKSHLEVHPPVIDAAVIASRLHESVTTHMFRRFTDVFCFHISKHLSPTIFTVLTC